MRLICRHRIATAVLLIAAALDFASCIEWGTNGQGQLNSMGVPGLPVWQSQELSEQQHLAAEGDLAASPGTVLDASAASLVSTDSDARWLADVNTWRTEAGIQPVGVNLGLSAGAADHACYLVHNGPKDPADFHTYEMTLEGAAHKEDPGNQYFTPEGEKAGHTGDIAWERDPEADVNSLVEAPFHRLSILAPWMRTAGYGDCGHFPMRAGTLVLRGTTPVGLTKMVMFPAKGSTVPTAMRTSEWPNPLDACQGYSFPVGTPITIQVGALIKTSLRAYSVTDEATGQKIEACGFDSTSYPDSSGRRSLLYYGAIVVIPRRPLSAGHTYRVNVETGKHSFEWNFTAR